MGLIVLLSFTVFSLKKVELDYRTSHFKISATDEQIIENANFAKGGSVFFHGKKEYIEKIENLDPYINVINIETVFPSKFVVHLAERQEVYALPFEGGHYICDEELRVLRVEQSFTNDPSNAIVLNLSAPLTGEALNEGEYISNQTIPPIYQALFENNRKLGEQTELIESITISSELTDSGKEQKVATLKLFSGQVVRIVNYNKGLTSKIKLMLDVYSQLFNYIGKTLSTPEGDVVLTENHLKTCTIEINSYKHPSYGKNDCYFNIFIT